MSYLCTGQSRYFYGCFQVKLDKVLILIPEIEIIIFFRYPIVAYETQIRLQVGILT